MCWGFAATNHVEGFGGARRSTEWTYYTSGNGKGQVRTEVKSSGLRTDYVYDSLGRVSPRTDALGYTTATSYSTNGLVSTIVYPNTSTVVTTRNAGGDLLSVAGTAVTPEFRTSGMSPDGTRWTRVVRGEGPDSPRFERRFYNMLGWAVRNERSGFRSAILTTTYAYDVYGRLVSSATDGEPTSEFTYDLIGNRIATTTSVGSRVPRDRSDEWRRSESSSVYTIRGNAVYLATTNITSCSDASIAPLFESCVVQLTDLTATNPSRIFSTDVRGNVTESWTEFVSGVATTKRRVPEATNVISSRSRYGVTLEEISLSAVASTTVYDALGRILRTVDGRGNTTASEYDARGRRSATVDAAGGRTAYAYDALGRPVAATNALGEATVYAYDLRGRKTYEGGATYPVRYAYDVFGNRVSMTTYRNEASEIGDSTHWFYDEASGAMTNKVYADGMGPTYSYDANGRLTRRTWARGVETFYAYDGWGNLTNTAYSDGTPAVSVRYDAMGREIEARDAAGTTAFAYDAFGANTNETVVGVAGTNVIERFTDACGRDAGYALNGVRRTTLAYDPATGRLATMLAAGSATPFAWTYLAGSDLKESLSYPNGDVVRWAYETNRDLVTLVSNGVHSAFRYAYDAAGRRVSKNDERYGYNGRGELVLATNVATGAEFAYRYDDVGNRVWSREFGTNCVYAANELNQYTNVVRGGVFERPAFDLDGSQTNVVTSTGEWAVEYNGENRPVRWTRPADGAVVAMSYDRMGRRVTKNGETYVYDGYLQIAEDDCSLYVWDPTEKIATRPLVWQRGDSAAYYTHDGNKNVSEVVAADGFLAAHYEYAPFGTVTAQRGVSAAVNPWRFSSEYAEDETGTVYYNYRHYEPLMGRWMCFDDLLSGDELLLYAFVKNNPVLAHDDLGHKCCKCPVVLPPLGSHGAGHGDFWTCGMGNLGFTHYTSWTAECDGEGDCGNCTISQTFLCAVFLTQRGYSFYWMGLSGEISGCSKR